MRIEIIPCLQDNYSYLIIDESNESACVVDPSESGPIVNFLNNKNIRVERIIIILNSNLNFLGRKCLIILFNSHFLNYIIKKPDQKYSG